MLRGQLGFAYFSDHTVLIKCKYHTLDRIPVVARRLKNKQAGLLIT
jgi:hypothetical protein